MKSWVDFAPMDSGFDNDIATHFVLMQMESVAETRNVYQVLRISSDYRSDMFSAFMLI